VHDELSQDVDAIDDRIKRTREELHEADPAERVRGYWRQVLSVESAAYWRAFSRGTLGARATEMLDHEIDAQLDRLTAGDAEPPARRVQRLPRWLTTAAGWLRGLGSGFPGVQLRLLALRYDLYRGEQLAAERVLEQIDTLIDDAGESERELREKLRKVYQGYLHGAKEQLEDLRANLPELTVAIETRLAHRIRLNFERESYQDLKKVGAVDHDAAEEALSSVEERMSRGLRMRPWSACCPQAIRCSNRATAATAPSSSRAARSAYSCRSLTRTSHAWWTYLGEATSSARWHCSLAPRAMPRCVP
jgi:hypothetical protein